MTARALATTTLKGEQRAALRAAFRDYHANAALPLAFWREVGMRLTGGGAGGGGGGGSAGGPCGGSPPAPPCLPPPPPPVDELLLARLERCIGACALHFTMFIARFYSIVSSAQVVALHADCFPYSMRPALLAQALDEEAEAEEAATKSGGG